jgi:hypothetical protein
MESKIFTLGDLKEVNLTWDYPRLQINITETDLSFFPELKSEFQIHLGFLKGKIINKKRREYFNGIFWTNVVNDHSNRFGKGTVATICAIWRVNKREGILFGWLKDHQLSAGDKIKISLKDSEYFLETV